jgi:hypothetical protein
MEAAQTGPRSHWPTAESATTRRIDREPDTDLTWSCFIRPHQRHRHTRHHDRGGCHPPRLRPRRFLAHGDRRLLLLPSRGGVDGWTLPRGRTSRPRRPDSWRHGGACSGHIVRRLNGFESQMTVDGAPQAPSTDTGRMSQMSQMSRFDVPNVPTEGARLQARGAFTTSSSP